MSKAPSDVAPNRRVRSFGQDVLSVFSTNAMVLVLALGSGILSARLLGVEGKGIVTALLVVPSLAANLAKLGVRQSAAYLIGQQIYTTSEVGRSVVTLFLLCSGLATVAVLGYFVWLSDVAQSVSLTVLASVMVPLHILLSYASGMFLGRQQIGSFNQINRIPSILRFAGLIVLVWIFGLGVLGAVVTSVAASAAAAVYVVSVLSRWTSLRPGWNRKVVSALLGRGLTYALTLFVLQINYRLDIVLLEQLSTADQIGLYSVGVNFAELIWQVPTALNIVVFARSAATTNREQFSAQLSQFVRLAFAITAAAALVLGLIAPLIVPLMYGNSFSASVTPMQIILPGIVAFVFIKVLYGDVAGRGKPEQALWVLIPAATLNVVLNVWLIPPLGANGAATASSISYIVAAVGFLALYSRVSGLSAQSLLRYRADDIRLVRQMIAKYLP
jgi:O-antigen/teichoic acid export membrane protein